MEDKKIPLEVAYGKLRTEHIQVRTKVEGGLWVDDWTITSDHSQERDGDVSAYDVHGTIFSAPKDTPTEILDKSIRFQDRGQHVEIRFLDVQVRDKLEARLFLE